MKSNLLNKKVIARIDRAGVFFGTLESIDNDLINLTDARRIYYWEGAISVTDMAVNGISRASKITAPVSRVEFLTSNLVEINECSDRAINTIENIPIWKM